MALFDPHTACARCSRASRASQHHTPATCAEHTHQTHKPEARAASTGRMHASNANRPCECDARHEARHRAHSPDCRLRVLDRSLRRMQRDHHSLRGCAAKSTSRTAKSVLNAKQSFASFSTVPRGSERCSCTNAASARRGERGQPGYVRHAAACERVRW